MTATSPESVVRELAARPGAELHETHGSWVVVSGDRALKVKKPVRFTFLDYGTPEARLRACEEEVRINQALAPGIYLGVRALTAADGRVVDHAIEMRRYDEDATMEAHVRSGRLDEAQVAAVAARLAAFHAAAVPEPDAPEQPGAWSERARADLDDLAALGVDVDGPRGFCAAAVARHGATMRERRRAGLVRDGHGDLQAEHVLLSEPPLIVDRLEFDPALRRVDVADDLAFLVMDLERLGARWAADRLVAAYTESGGAAAPAPLAALFAWRRAVVRAKVALLAGRPDEGRAVLGLAERLAWRARRPLRIAVMGPPASGKSTVARALAERLELPVLASDVVRRRLEPVPGYTPEQRAAAYRELIRSAAATAREAGGVIVDATFAERSWRDALAAALDGVAWIACSAPADTLAQRAAARLAEPDRLSDAGPDVALAVAEHFEDPGEAALRLDTRAAPEELVGRVAAWLDTPPLFGCG